MELILFEKTSFSKDHFPTTQWEAIWETEGILFQEWCFGSENSLSSEANSASSAKIRDQKSMAMAMFKRKFARASPDNLRAPHIKMWGFEAKRARKFTRTSPRTLPFSFHYHAFFFPAKNSASSPCRANHRLRGTHRVPKRPSSDTFHIARYFQR